VAAARVRRAVRRRAERQRAQVQRRAAGRTNPDNPDNQRTKTTQKTCDNNDNQDIPRNWKDEKKRADLKQGKEAQERGEAQRRA